MKQGMGKNVPVYAKLLALVGTLLAGLGLAEAWGGTQLVPAEWRIDHHGWYLLGAGYFLMTPFTLEAISARKASPEAEGPPA